MKASSSTGSTTSRWLPSRRCSQRWHPMPCSVWPRPTFRTSRRRMPPERQRWELARLKAREGCWVHNRVHAVGGGRSSQPSKRLLDRKTSIHLGTQILSQENSESNGHLSRKLSKFGPSQTSGTWSRGGARRGKVSERRSPPLAPQSATKAASHPGKTLGPSPARPRAT